MVEFVMADRLDVDALSAAFAASGRIRIDSFLDAASAAALHQELVASRDWRLTANRGEQVIDFADAQLRAFGPDQWAKLRRAVELGGRYGFQFCYETIRLAHDGDSGDSLLARFADFMSSPAVVGLVRSITGAADIGFADAHASRYRAHHFLTTHDDRVDQMGRRAAYVLGLTPEWRPDWGGLLLFHDANGNIVRGEVPAFNTLDLFSVPQPHSVSWVTPLAAAPRYAITGWLRSHGDRDLPASPDAAR